MINFKFRAIKDRNFIDGEPCFRKGEIYAVEDSKITFAGGWTSNVSANTFEEFMKCNSSFKGHIVEIRNIDFSKTYKGYEIVQMLHEHELKEGDKIKFKDGFLNKEFDIVQCSEILSLRDEDNEEIGNSYLTSPEGEFTIIPHVEKVDFITAWKAYLDGKRITSCEGYSYQNGKMYRDSGSEVMGLFSIHGKELDGEWIVEEGGFDGDC